MRVRDRVSLYRFAFDVIDVHVCCSFLATAHKLVKQFGERLVSQHKQWCPWRTNFCTEEMAAPPLSTKEEELSKLATRFAREPLFVRVVAWACLCVCVCVRLCMHDVCNSVETKDNKDAPVYLTCVSRLLLTPSPKKGAAK